MEPAPQIDHVTEAVRAVTLALRRVNATLASEAPDSRAVGRAVAALQAAVAQQGRAARQVMGTPQTTGA